MFAIIDVETTGLSAKQEKLTEIAIIIHDGFAEVERFQTLLNPERKIPYRITQLTGINDQMVANSPKFYEVAKKIIELTEGKTIVAHNVTFDYGFIKAEFMEFGYDFQRETLCTVRTSRKVFPGMPSYSLSRLTTAFGIEHSMKHRAMGDAEATKLLFEHIIKSDPTILNGKVTTLPKALSEEVVKSLPQKPGVYYFKNSSGGIIYVGKSKNIRQRVRQHLSNYETKKAVEMLNNISSIDFTITGNELIAMLLESEEIKRLKPIYNRAQLRSVFHYGIFTSIDEGGYFCLRPGRNEPMSNPVTTFSSQVEAKDFLHFLVDEYNLCLTKCGLYDTSGPCFNHQIHKCDGACTGEESPSEYNNKLTEAIERLKFNHNNFFLIEEGLNKGEFGVVQVFNGHYRGYGYIKEVYLDDLNMIKNCIQEKKSNKDTQSIILSYMRNNKYKMVLG